MNKRVAHSISVRRNLSKPSPRTTLTKDKIVQTRGATSRVIINMSNSSVTKFVTSYPSFTVYEREVYWLKYLNERGYTWCPRLIKTTPQRKAIVLEYAGKPITKANAPKDWKNQIQFILQDLANEGIKHNDIKRGEILVKSGKLSLIDYGWASKGDDWTCGGLFDGKPKPCHKFRDNTALMRLASVLDK